MCHYAEMMTKLSQEEITKIIEEANKQIEIGGIYQHYKNHEYLCKVLHLGLIEETSVPCVIYQALHGSEMIWVRPLSNWLEKVEYKGKMIPRFQLIKQLLKTR